MLAVVVASLAAYRWWLTGYALQDMPFTGETQGTTYAIKIASPPLDDARKRLIDETIHQRLESIDRVLSNYRPDSELEAFNRQQTTDPIPASPEFVEVVQLARTVSDASNGAFDVTVVPLVAVWGFGPVKPENVAPTDAELSQLLQKIGYRKIEVNADAKTIRKTQPDVTCDLNGIAQGYTVDKLGDDLRALGYADFVVEVGGEVIARGRNSRGIPWQVAIEKPVANARELQEVIPLENRAISTSGDYRDYLVKDGVRISHTIDPQTGRPIAHALASVSVLHEQCALADAWATALMVLGPDKGYDLAVAKGLAALFIIHDPEQGFDARSTPAFEKIGR
jgi:thiamine biosynthesis lipoprotein